MNNYDYLKHLTVYMEGYERTGKESVLQKITATGFFATLVINGKETNIILTWEDSLDRKNRIHCLFMLALGYTGLGDAEHAERYLKEVEEMDINHQGVRALRTFVQKQ